MTIDDVLTLAKAGYTRDEIAQMLQPEPAADPAPAADPVPAADPTPAPAPAEPAQPAQEQTILPAWAQAMSESLAALTKAVQTNNALHDEQPPAPAQSALDAVLLKQLH